MSVNRNEKLKFASPLQSLFKNHRFFTNFKPQFAKTATQNDLQHKSRLTGFSLKQLDFTALSSKMDLRQSNSRSKSREARQKGNPTIQYNFYNYHSPNSMTIGHNKKTSIDLDNSLKKDTHELLHLSKRMASNNPNRPLKKMDSFLGDGSKASRLYQTMHQSSRNMSNKRASGPLTSTVNPVGTFDTVHPFSHFSQAFKLNGQVLKKSHLSKISSDLRPEKGQNITLVLEERPPPDLVTSNSTNTEPIRAFLPLPAYQSLKLGSSGHSQSKPKRNSVSRSGFEFGSNRGGEAVFRLNNGWLRAENKLLRSYDEDITKKHFYQTEKVLPKPPSFPGPLEVFLKQTGKYFQAEEPAFGLRFFLRAPRKHDY
jgi:hypothetical protein